MAPEVGQRILERSYVWLSQKITPELVENFKQATKNANLSEVLDMIVNNVFDEEVTAEFQAFLDTINLLDEA